MDNQNPLDLLAELLERLDAVWASERQRIDFLNAALPPVDGMPHPVADLELHGSRRDASARLQRQLRDFPLEEDGTPTILRLTEELRRRRLHRSIHGKLLSAVEQAVRQDAVPSAPAEQRPVAPSPPPAVGPDPSPIASGIQPETGAPAAGASSGATPHSGLNTPLPILRGAGTETPLHLQQDLHAAKAVVLIRIPSLACTATGFMITPRLLLTAGHVASMNLRRWIEHAVFRFFFADYAHGYGAPRLSPLDIRDLDPAALVFDGTEYDATLDAAVVRLDQAPAGVDNSGPDGFEPIQLAYNPARVGDEIRILHHPDGKELVISREHNHVEALLPEGVGAFTYRAFTQGGSSGAPVLNAASEVIGIHSGKHAPGAQDSPPLNRALPIGALLLHLQAHHKALFDEILAHQPRLSRRVELEGLGG